LEELEQLRIKVAAYEQEIEELRGQAEECNQTLSAMWEQQRQLQQCVTAAQEFSADVYALSKDLYERAEAYTRQQFGEETVDALSEDVPTQETPAEEAAEEKADAPVETASNASDGNMERWLF
jgi:chromosome segregation ATPase